MFCGLTAELEQERLARKAALHNALLQEDSFQKDRIRWLKEGDQNRTFFHTTTKIRRSRKKFGEIQKERTVLGSLTRMRLPILLKHYELTFASGNLPL